MLQTTGRRPPRQGGELRIVHPPPHNHNPNLNLNPAFRLHPSSFRLHPSSFILQPFAFRLHPSSFILHPLAAGSLTQRRNGAKAQRVFPCLATWGLGGFALKGVFIREIRETCPPQARRRRIRGSIPLLAVLPPRPSCRLLWGEPSIQVPND
jgi:hypothetical protein